MNYHEDIEIDIYNLEKCWQEHPSHVIKYGELWSDQITIRENQEEKCNRLKDELTEVKASLENFLRVKENWEKYGFQKSPTGQAADSWSITQPSYKEKQNELYEARKQLIKEKEKENKLKIVYYAFSTNQKEALQNEVKLYIRGYYSELSEKDQDLEEIHYGMKPRVKTNKVKGEDYADTED